MTYKLAHSPCRITDASDHGQTIAPYRVILRAENGAQDAIELLQQAVSSRCTSAHCQELARGAMPVFADPEAPPHKATIEEPWAGHYSPLEREHASYPMLDARPLCRVHGGPLITCNCPIECRIEQPRPVYEPAPPLPAEPEPRDPAFARKPFVYDTGWTKRMEAIHPNHKRGA